MYQVSRWYPPLRTYATLCGGFRCIYCLVCRPSVLLLWVGFRSVQLHTGTSLLHHGQRCTSLQFPTHNCTYATLYDGCCCTELVNRTCGLPT